MPLGLFDRTIWTRARRDPIILLGLLIDLTPVLGVIFLGWGASALVMLYWLENLLIGLFTLGRIVLAAVSKSGILGILFGAYICAFFTVHYGMFCWGHGSFLISFAPDLQAQAGPLSPGDLPHMIEIVLEAWPSLQIPLYLLACWQAFIFVREDLPYARENADAMNPVTEMFAPYGRIVVLHIAIFAAAFALLAMGDPMVGALILILLRAALGVGINLTRRFLRKPRSHATAG